MFSGPKAKTSRPVKTLTDVKKPKPERERGRILLACGFEGDTAGVLRIRIFTSPNDFTEVLHMAT